MIASQDLKNTLATLLGVAQFLSKNYQAIDSAGLLDFLNMLELSSGQMLQLICNILDVNKIESNCLNYTLEKVDILPLLFMLVESYAEIARIKHIDLITNIRMDQEFSPIYVNADRTLLPVFATPKPMWFAVFTTAVRVLRLKIIQNYSLNSVG
jgi:signal transduction histidine kinase